MTDSADIKMAAERLQQALRKLEGSLDPLLGRLSQLERESVESQSFEQDRAALAAKLDEAKSREEDYQAREKEFAQLADETTQELDRVIRQVSSALGDADGED